MNPGKVTSPDLQAYQEAAAKWREELLHFVYFKLNDALKLMTVRLGVRYEEKVGSATLGAQFRPYKPKVHDSKDLNIIWRTLHTYFGMCVLDFEPNSVISTIMGRNAAKMGEAQKNSKVAFEVLKSMTEDLSESLYNAIWTAKHDPDGTTTNDLFDGFQTIIDADILAGKIAADKGNFLEITEEITDVNAYDVLKKTIRKADKKLRNNVGLIAYMPEWVKDMYEDAYLATHSAVPYNTQFNQPKIEGTRATIECGSYLDESKYIVLSIKENMLVGMDQQGDEEKIEVNKYDSFVLTFEATCFFGTQFETIDKSRLCVIKLPGGEESGSGSASGSASGSESGSASE